MDTENRRSFVKKSLATSMTFTFSGLIRAHGDEGGETTYATTVNPEESTFATTDSGGTTTWNPDESTIPEETTVVTTEETTTPTSTSPKVIGTVDSGATVHYFSAYWWFKAKMYASSPNPHETVTMTIHAAGAEIGTGGGTPSPTEQVSHSYELAGTVDSEGNFTASKSGAVGSSTSVSIGTTTLPGGISVHVFAFVRIDSITPDLDHLKPDEKYDSATMKGVVWAEYDSGTGTAKSPEYDWQVTVRKN